MLLHAFRWKQWIEEYTNLVSELRALCLTTIAKTNTCGDFQSCLGSNARRFSYLLSRMLIWRWTIFSPDLRALCDKFLGRIHHYGFHKISEHGCNFALCDLFSGKSEQSAACSLRKLEWNLKHYGEKDGIIPSAEYLPCCWDSGDRRCSCSSIDFQRNSWESRGS